MAGRANPFNTAADSDSDDDRPLYFRTRKRQCDRRVTCMRTNSEPTYYDRVNKRTGKREYRYYSCRIGHQSSRCGKTPQLHSTLSGRGLKSLPKTMMVEKSKSLAKTKEMNRMEMLRDKFEENMIKRKKKGQRRHRRTASIKSEEPRRKRKRRTASIKSEARTRTEMLADNARRRGSRGSKRRRAGRRRASGRIKKGKRSGRYVQRFSKKTGKGYRVYI